MPPVLHVGDGKGLWHTQSTERGKHTKHAHPYSQGRVSTMFGATRALTMDPTSHVASANTPPGSGCASAGSSACWRWRLLSRLLLLPSLPLLLPGRIRSTRAGRECSGAMPPSPGPCTPPVTSSASLPALLREADREGRAGLHRSLFTRRECFLWRWDCAAAAALASTDSLSRFTAKSKQWQWWGAGFRGWIHVSTQSGNKVVMLLHPSHNPT